MIVNSKGHIEAPSEIVRRLQQIDPALGMKFMPLAGCFCLTYEWPENDPRRQMVRAGKQDPETAYDAWGYAPPNVSVGDAYHCLVAGLRRNAQTKQAARDMLDRVHAYNKEQETRNLQPSLDYADEMVEYNAPHLLESTMGKTSLRHFVSTPEKAAET